MWITTVINMKTNVKLVILYLWIGFFVANAIAATHDCALQRIETWMQQRFLPVRLHKCLCNSLGTSIKIANSVFRSDKPYETKITNLIDVYYCQISYPIHKRQNWSTCERSENEECCEFYLHSHWTLLWKVHWLKHSSINSL